MRNRIGAAEIDAAELNSAARRAANHATAVVATTKGTEDQQ